MVSVEVMSWVLHHSPTTGTDKVLLLGIANHADSDGGNAWPSLATLATYAHVSERSAQRALRRLADEGHITIELRAGGTHRTRGDRRPNLYAVNGVTPTSPGGADGVTSSAPRGDVQRAHGVTPTSPEPSLEPSLESSSAREASKLTVEEQFEVFWQRYPERDHQRRGRRAALQQWKKLSLGDRRTAAKAVVNYATFCQTTGQKAKDAHRWLRDRLWEENLSPPSTEPVIDIREEAALAADRAAHAERVRMSDERDRELLAREAEWEAYRASPEFAKRGEMVEETLREMKRNRSMAEAGAGP